MKAIFTIYPDGTVHKTVQKKNPDLRQLQEGVNGFIERVPHFTKIKVDDKVYNRGTCWCNENGLTNDDAFNWLATAMWKQNLEGKGPLWYEPQLYGTIVFVATEK